MTQLIAPPEMTIQTLPYAWKGKQRLTVSLMLATPIDNHQPYSTQDAWNGIMEVIPKAECFDLGYPKPRGEVLVYGNYYAPDGFAISSDNVLLQVGSIKKELMVTGERLWRKILTPTTPEPFTQIPLTYEMGFGGKEDDRNPIGKGHPLESDTPMPQLEYPDQLLVKKHQKPAPAGLNATSVDWMPRKTLWGTYDTAWQEHDAPFLAKDLNPDFFMQAAQDQWFEHYVPGNTPILLENMHPHHRKIEGLTPDYQLQFLAEIKGQASLHQAVTDTLILLPDINMQVVIARAELEIASIDGSEVTALLASYSAINQPENRTLQHFSNHLQLRRSDTITDEEILDYSPLRPSRVKEPLTPLVIPGPEKTEIARPGTLTLAALAAAGGLAAKMAAAAAKSTGGGQGSKDTTTADTEAPATSKPAMVADKITAAQAEHVADALKTQFEAMGLTDQQLNELIQAEPDQIPVLINQMLAQLFPDQALPDPENPEADPLVQEQLHRAGELADANSSAIPESGNAAIDNEIARALAKPGQSPDFTTLEPLVEDQLNRVSEELAQLYDAYPGDKSELDPPSDIGTKAIINLLKGLSGKS
ncbi:DUF2169 family type VI secretion system accessory protein [Oceanospirillum linum]|uniref:DUF2169 domain-containing protein n=1 Tax=Oceanospirillum linum TaxID=966 RepID=A0A1T1HDI2_OCELI|nr:DUF2169 domain-containing protein [Oceanospirillum linum]OOV87777.1 hypothetical protein BTA35_0207150 [Oceanospirillum linum]SEG12715.1 hypothetical protein SAMN04489856_105138 [Oleiphilus messinensis]SMP09784.1 hypothetical protein SAMN06264348_102139 [Oceanospirillum linum]